MPRRPAGGADKIRALDMPSEERPMATPAVPLVDLPKIILPETDGEPLESTWHRDQINLLLDVIRCRFHDRKDFFAGGNMFIYFSFEQARNRSVRGPDFFYVRGVRYDPLRPSWVVWEEDGKYPDVIVELLSPSTAHEDRTTKKRLYESTFRTPNYFCYDPDTRELEGWHLVEQTYEALKPNDRGWLWSAELHLWLGTWVGEYQGSRATWLRFYDRYQQLVPLQAEGEGARAEAERQRAEAERQRAEAERERAEAAEAEVARLRALLAAQQPPDAPGDPTGA
jgi:Uma2 family endonuclease